MTFEPRHVPADTTISYTDTDGSQVDRHSAPLKGDADYHVITPRNRLEAAVLDSLEAPVARKAIATASTPKTTGKRSSAKTTAAASTVAEPANEPAAVQDTSASDPQPAESDGGSV